MIGVLAGDIIGSIYEGSNIKKKDFELFGWLNRFTDDSTLTIATIDKLLNHRTYTEVYLEYGRRYPDAGFGGGFRRWFKADVQVPYQSNGNGSAMRVCPVGWLFNHSSMVINEATESAIVTHDSQEGIRGAQSVAMCVFLAKNGFSKQEIETYVTERFKYDLSFKLDDVRPDYKFDFTCNGSVPIAIKCFLESTGFEDAIRLAVSMGGDTDTIAAIVGGISEAYYGGVPDEIKGEVMSRIPDEFKIVLNKFYETWVTVDVVI